jgi:ubiquinone/menaquinone biosynthesis C-methylase UbiE
MSRISTATLEYNKEITELYNLIDSKDDNEHFVKLFLKLHNSVEGSLIDLCCGLGKLCDEFKKFNPSLSIVGCDKSVDMLSQRTDFIVGDVTNLTGTYDNVISTYGYRHFDNVEQFWETVFRLSHDKTKILICDWVRPDDLDSSINQFLSFLTTIDAPELTELHPMTELCVRSTYSKSELENHIKKYPTLKVHYHDTGIGIELFYVYNTQ